MNPVDVLVKGDGAVGRSLALVLARQGLSVALVGAAAASPKRGPDIRTYALGAASVALLQSIKVWEAMPPDAVTPVYDMHIAGDQTGAQLDFSSYQAGLSALTWIVDAAALDEVLASAVRFAPHIQLVDAPVPAALTALCEGKASATRAELGVTFDVHAYGHWGVAARLTASLPHAGRARQWFASPDVLALLPFDRPQLGHSYGLVWSLPQARAEALLALPEAEFEAELMQATGGVAGDLKLSGERAAWPLGIARAERLVGPGWALLGDAAHVVHPLSGQGLNLGLGDVQALAQVLAERESFRALGDEKLLRRYARARAMPVWAMGQLTDGLLHLFANDQPLVRALRNQGLSLVNQLGPLKRWLTHRASQV